MSYTIYIQKFKSKTKDNFDLNQLNILVDKHGRIVKTEYGLEIITENSQLFENADLNGRSNSEITNLSIHRPSNDRKLRELIFDILKIDGTCFFDQDLSFLLTRQDTLQDFPQDLLDNCQMKQIKRLQDLVKIF